MTVPAKRESGLPRLSAEALLALTAVIGILVFLNTLPIRPHDFWWHLQAGREIWHHRRIPLGDTLAYTVPGKPYSSYAAFWLAEVMLYLFYAMGGPALVVFVHSLIVTVAYGLVMWLCWRVAGTWRMAYRCMLFAAVLGMLYWNVRPQSFALLMGAILLLGIYECRRRPRPAWLIVFPLDMLAWANSHGSFPLGLGMLAIWLADEGWSFLRAGSSDDRRLRASRLVQPAIALALSVLACLLNPRGPGILLYLTTMSGSPIVQELIPEWAPPSFNSVDGALFLVALLLSAGILAVSPRRPSLFQLLTFLVFAALALKTSRGIIWFGIVMAPILAHHLPVLAPRSQHSSGTRRVLLKYLLVATALGMTLASLPWFKQVLPLPQSKESLISAETPVAATGFLLRERLPGPLFHEQVFGSYLIWAAQPEYPVFVDGRVELYPPRVWLDYLDISAASCGWEEKLDAYGVKTLMLSPQEQAALIKAVGESPKWRLVYQDPYALLFVRAG